MKHCIYKLKFDTGVHFGKSGLTDYEICLHADTIFSALCQEVLRLKGQKGLNQLMELVRNNQLLISDAFPFKAKQLFIPKPYIHVKKQNQDGDSSMKKQMKNMKYIQMECLSDFVNGEYSPENIVKERDFGQGQLKTNVAIRGMSETEPYRVKYFMFEEDCGLYMIVGYETDETVFLLEELLESLSYSGIGGKRYSGFGRFSLFSSSIPAELEKRLTAEGSLYMTLSVSLPTQEELGEALHGASYQLVKRSGFVSSENYAETYMRKKDLYVFYPGACFVQKYRGDIYDVSSGGNHPVYRYAKPMFLEVK